MASLFKPTYSKPIPAGAEYVTHKDRPHVRFKDESGKPVLAPLTKKGDRCRVKAAMWYGQYKNADDKLCRVPLSENKTAAQQMLNSLVGKAELGKVSIADPFEDLSRRSLREHLADCKASLKADGVSAKQVGKVVTRT